MWNHFTKQANVTNMRYLLWFSGMLAIGPPKQTTRMTTDDIETSNLLLELFSSVFTKEDVSTTPELAEREIAHSMADVVITV